MQIIVESQLLEDVKNDGTQTPSKSIYLPDGNVYR